METIADRVQHLRQQLGLSQAGLAKRLGTSPQSIQQLEAGQIARPRYLTELATCLHISPEWLLTGREPTADDVGAPASVAPHAWRRDLPVLGKAVGGDDGEFMLNGERHEYISRPPHLGSVDNAFAVYMTGDSMEPRYFAGDMLYVNPNRPAAPGDFVVVELTDGQAMVKRLARRTAKAIRLEQYNPAKVFEVPRSRVKGMYLIVLAGRG